MFFAGVADAAKYKTLLLAWSVDGYGQVYMQVVSKQPCRANFYGFVILSLLSPSLFFLSLSLSLSLSLTHLLSA